MTYKQAKFALKVIALNSKLEKWYLNLFEPKRKKQVIK